MWWSGWLGKDATRVLLQCNLREVYWKENELLALPEMMAGGRTRRWALCSLCLSRKVEELLVVPSNHGRCLPKLKEVVKSDSPIAR